MARLNDRSTAEEMAQNVQDLTIDGKCSNCGNCCTEFVPLTKKETETIRKYLKQHPEIKMHRHLDKENIEILCPFRDKVNKRCTIYEVRPRVCRRFICNLPPATLAKNKDEGVDRAYYNGRDTTKWISLHALFFEDYDWELLVYYHLFKCKSVDDLIKVLKDRNPLLGPQFIKALKEQRRR